MRRARNSGNPPVLAQIEYLKIGHLVRYDPAVCRAAKERMPVVPGQAHGGTP
jgi:hypothetical protein